jgi:hypothetical protein
MVDPELASDACLSARIDEPMIVRASDFVIESMNRLGLFHLLIDLSSIARPRSAYRPSSVSASIFISFDIEPSFLNCPSWALKSFERKLITVIFASWA